MSALPRSLCHSDAAEGLPSYRCHESTRRAGTRPEGVAVTVDRAQHVLENAVMLEAAELLCQRAERFLKAE